MTCKDLGNTGQMSCPYLMKIIKRVMLVPLYDSSGDPTKIANADLTKTALQLRFNESEQQDRIYPLPLLENVTDERGEPITFEWDGGGKSFIRENPRTFSGRIKRITPELTGRILKWNGQEMGFYAFDADGNFIYSKDATGGSDYYPIQIDSGSLYAGLIKATNSDPLMGMITFDTEKSVKDSDLRYVLADNLDFNGLSNTDVYGLIEVNVSITSSSATQTVFTASLDNGVALEGLTSSDIELYNVTDSASVTVTTLTESATVPGTYTAAYSSGLDAADTAKVTIAKDRFSHSYDTEVVS